MMMTALQSFTFRVPRSTNVFVLVCSRDVMLIVLCNCFLSFRPLMLHFNRYRSLRRRWSGDCEWAAYVLATVVPNRDRRCWGVGPNYWRTFDGLEYLFFGHCVYTLFSDGMCTVTVDMSGCTSFTHCRKVNKKLSKADRRAR